MVTYDLGSSAFVKLGDKAWTDVKVRCQLHYDVVYYKSQFYLVGEGCVFACINIDGDQAPSTKPIASNPKHLIVDTMKYMVESNGELLVVFRYFQEEIPYTTTSFVVLRLVKTNESSGQREYEFEEVKTLGDRALFLGHNASFSLSTTHLNGYRGDCIYFTDDMRREFMFSKYGVGFDMGTWYKTRLIELTESTKRVQPMMTRSRVSPELGGYRGGGGGDNALAGVREEFQHWL
ncbi:hypothetical protein ACFE04_009897 [Oxalis oulophora]